MKQVYADSTVATSHAVSDPAAREYALDALRVLAALMVVAYHFMFLGKATGAISNMPEAMRIQGMEYGFLGVNFFFMISGYVILKSAEMKSAWAFALGRALRLYPVYWVCCTITFCFSVLIGAPEFIVTVKQYLINMTMLNLPLNVESIDGVYWSLFAEMRFYFWVFLLLLFGGLRFLHPILWLWLGLTLLYQHWPLADASLRETGKHLFMLNWSPYFAAGATFYLARRDGWSPLLATLASSALALAITGLPEQLRAVEVYVATDSGHADNIQQFLNNGAGYFIIACFFVIFLLHSLKQIEWMRWPGIRFMGNLTYPVYLLHQVIGMILIQRWILHMNPWLSIGLTFAIVVAMAAVIHLAVERHGVWALRRKVRESGTHPAEATEVAKATV